MGHPAHSFLTTMPPPSKHEALPRPSRPAAAPHASRRALAAVRRWSARVARGVAGLLDGPGRMTGALAGAAVWLLAGPAWVPAAVVGGACAGRAVLRHRRMTAREQALAAAVFGASLPATHYIVLTDLAGVGGTCFVCPGLGGQILVNLGRRAFEDPIGCCSPAYAAPGKLFVHELAHVWQLAHGQYFPRLLPRILAGPRAGDDCYRPPASLERPWPRLGLEQQATVVDEWFHPGHLGPAGWAGTPGMSEAHPYWAYVRDVIRAAPVRG